jgi:hypothetical protein
MSKNITVDDMVKMTKAQVVEVFKNGHPIEPGSIDNKQYRGVDLSLPAFMHKILWQTFRKTFYRDPATKVLRGWNVKMEQTGWHDAGTPKKKKNGELLTFGHYHVLPAKGKKFPGGWQGADYLDYGVAGNAFFDVAKLGYCPLIAVNKGSSELLLGWEIFKLGGLFIPLNDYWALKLEGPIQNVIPPPNVK